MNFTQYRGLKSGRLPASPNAFTFAPMPSKSARVEGYPTSPAGTVLGKPKCLGISCKNASVPVHFTFEKESENET